MSTDRYVEKSLELHLFFGRIMKEHALFLRAGFTPANASWAEQAERYQQEFEKVMCQAINLANGMICPQVLRSGELITEFTPSAERQTERLTGISINKEITAREQRLSSSNNRRMYGDMAARRQQVKMLNQTVLKLLSGFISFKENILNNVLRCEMFTANYPLLLEHIIREAKLYCQYVEMLEQDGTLGTQSMKEIECFWNQIMMEHALFIRGLLDPCEKELFTAAHGLAGEFEELLERCRCAQDQTLTADSLRETVKIRDFKFAGTQGILQCKIRSVILPLLADHVLREANHYIRLLRS